MGFFDVGSWDSVARSKETLTVSLVTRMKVLLLVCVVLASFVFLSSIREASGGITSSFVRSVWPSLDIPLNHEAFAVPKGYNAPQQVSLTNITWLILLSIPSYWWIKSDDDLMPQHPN